MSAVMDKLDNTPAPARTAQERARRVGFLRAAPDLRHDGFDLDTGNVSGTWQAINLGAWEQPEGLDADADLAALRSLHERAGKEWRGMAEALAAVAKDDDPSLNDAGRLKLAAKLIEGRIDALAQVAEAELGKVDGSIAQEEAALTAAARVRDAADGALHDSIRAYWRAESTRANGKMLAAPIVTGTIDDDTLRAIATAPAYLSGITESLHAQARALYARRIAPDRVTRIDALRTGKAKAQQALDALYSTANRLIDFKGARELQAHETRRQAGG